MTQDSDEFRIGLVGCGNISKTYLRNAKLFKGMDIVGCSDLNADSAMLVQSEFGIEAMSVDALLVRDDIDLVLNLTVPQAHFEVSHAALKAGKHVFTEKPLGVTLEQGRELVAEALRCDRLIGSAPDTFLGAAGRTARRLVDAGDIGQPVTGTAFMLGRGMEHWHPDPSFYYQPGAGPLFDMGPYYLTMLVNLLGPIKRVQSLSASGQNERLITAEGPLQNTTFPVGTPTTVLSMLTFRSGAIIMFATSWDVFRHSNHPIELHGTEGSLRLPDPDTFGGSVSLSRSGEPWVDHDTAQNIFGAENWPFHAPDRANYRMLAIADLAQSLRSGTQPRASGALALHVLDVMESIAQASDTGEPVDVLSDIERPQAMSESQAQVLHI